MTAVLAPRGVAPVTLVGTPAHFDSPDNAGAATLTVPAGATGLLVFVGGYGDGSDRYFTRGTLTLAGLPARNIVSGDGSSGNHQAAGFYLDAPPVGDHTLAWDWPGTTAPGDGAVIVAVFVRAIDHSDPVRDIDGLQGISPFVSRQLYAEPGDLLVAFGEAFRENTASIITTSWTDASKVADYHTASGDFYRRTAVSLATAEPIGPQTVTFGASGSTGAGALAAVVLRPPAEGVTPPEPEPPGPGIPGALEAIAQALQPLTVQIPGLQITPYMNPNPTPPSIDVYPGDPFQTGAGFGVGASELFFTVRARVSTADVQSGQLLLLRMLDPTDAASVEAALEDVATVVGDGVSGFRIYLEDAATDGRLLGCEWRVATFL